MCGSVLFLRSIVVCCILCQINCIYPKLSRMSFNAILFGDLQTPSGRGSDHPYKIYKQRFICRPTVRSLLNALKYLEQSFCMPTHNFWALESCILQIYIVWTLWTFGVGNFSTTKLLSVDRLCVKFRLGSICLGFTGRDQSRGVATKFWVVRLPSRPFPSPPLPFPPSSLPIPSCPPLLLPPLRSRPLKYRGLGKRCKLPQRGLGRSPSGNRIWCILALKYDIWWHQFY